MDVDAVLAELEELGTAQNRKVWANHGVTSNYFGVSFGDLEKLKKKYKRDHALALALWETEVVDARLLATMIADPKAFDEEGLDTWAEDIQNYVLADVFARNVVAKSNHASDKSAAWIEEPKEFVARLGWTTLAVLATKKAPLDSEVLQERLRRIETDIHEAANRTREAMNSALIAIGGSYSEHQAEAIAAARRIGPVLVDHGNTSCKTPNAEEYIAKMVARMKSRAGTKKSPAKKKTRTKKK